jgi:hypothetical protein
MSPGCTTPITLHAQALALQEEGILVARIKEVTGFAVITIYCIKKSLERGHNPKLRGKFMIVGY